MYGRFRHDVGIKSVAEVNGIYVVTVPNMMVSITVPVVSCFMRFQSTEGLPLHCLSDQPFSPLDTVIEISTYHSKSLYMIVKKTCRKRLTAFMSTAKRYSHASPDIMEVVVYYLMCGTGLFGLFEE